MIVCELFRLILFVFVWGNLEYLNN